MQFRLKKQHAIFNCIYTQKIHIKRITNRIINRIIKRIIKSDWMTKANQISSLSIDISFSHHAFTMHVLRIKTIFFYIIKYIELSEMNKMI